MRFCPPPLTMFIISVMEILVYVIDTCSFKWDDMHFLWVSTIFSFYFRKNDSTNDMICVIRPKLQYSHLERNQIWRFVTYMFVHSDFEHLFFNVFCQIGLGIALELVHCWWRVATVYMSGILAASLAHSVLKPCVSLRGASGGVYSIITAHVATIILNWHEMKYGTVQLLVFLIFCSSDIYSDVFLGTVGISGVAHIFGAFAGILIGIGVLRNVRVKPYQQKLWIASIAAYCALIFLGVCYNLNFVIIQKTQYNSTTFNCTKTFTSNST